MNKGLNKHTYIFNIAAIIAFFFLPNQNQESMEIKIKQRKWNWIGHTLRKPEENAARPLSGTCKEADG